MSVDHILYIRCCSALCSSLLTISNRGAHLFTIAPRAWTAEVGDDKLKQVVAEGFELLKVGWEKDEVALRQSVVGPLM